MSDTPSGPLFVETANTNEGMFWRWWYCEPPADPLAAFRVVRDEWGTARDGRDLQRIFEISIAGNAKDAGPEGPAPPASAGPA